MWIELLHLFSLLLQVVYPWVTWRLPLKNRNTFDVVFISVVCAIYLHWGVFKGECIVSYWEKKQIDPSYRLGECPYVHPFECMLKGYTSDQKRSSVSLIIQNLSVLAFLVVMARVTSIGMCVKAGIVSAFLLVLAYYRTQRRARPTERCALLERKACKPPALRAA